MVKKVNKQPETETVSPNDKLKFEEAQDEYSKSEKGRLAQQKKDAQRANSPERQEYRVSHRNHVVQFKYRHSDKGQAAKKREHEKRKRDRALANGLLLRRYAKGLCFCGLNKFGNCELHNEILREIGFDDIEVSTNGTES